MNITISQLNAMDMLTFIQELGWVAEHSPWVIERVYPLRPFSNLEELHHSMVSAIQNLSEEEKLKLLLCHPDLGSRLQMTDASVSEQRNAGLDDLTAEEYDLLSGLNKAYTAKFGFPFIMAVKGQTKEAIIESMQRRILHPLDQELQTALAEIGKITRFRLEQRIAE